MKQPGHIKLLFPKTMMGFALKVLCLMAILPLTPLLNAQSFFGSVVGTVMDTSGAVVPDATVTVTNIGTSEMVKVKTDSGGKFSVVNLLPADYTVTVEKASFRRVVNEHVPVQVGQTTRVDSSLAVGNVSETVDVTTRAALLQTDSSSLSQEVEGQQVQQMPLNGRNVMNLLELAPGVIPGGSASGDTGLAQGTRSNNAAFNNYQIGGGLGNYGAQLIDGAPNNLLGGNIAGVVPTQDAVQEFSVVTSNATADLGRFAGGAVNLTTKSGSNSFHGSIYEYFRNTDFNANNWFSNHLGQARPKWNQNQYGAQVTGPIMKDKAFFMFTWEGFKALTGDLVPTNVPTVAMQNGVFPTTLKADPLGNCTIAPYTGQTVNGQNFAPGGSYISNLYAPGSNCGDPTNEVIKNFYPAPTPATQGPSNNWYFSTPLSNSQNQYNGRVDYQLTPNNRLFARYTYWTLADSAHSEWLNKGFGTTTWPDNDGAVSLFSHQAVLGDTVTLNASTILDVRATFTRVSNPDPSQTTTFNEATFDQYNPNKVYTALSPQMSLHTLPANRITGSDNLYSFGSVGNYSNYWWNNYGISANLTKIKGAHSIKVGADLRLMDGSGTGFPGASAGTYTYTNGVLGDEFADFLVGYPNTSGTNYATQFETYQIAAGYEYYQAYYLTDTWQAARNLTLNLGLRYDIPGGIAERNNKQTVLLPNTVDPSTGVNGTLGLVASSLYGPRAITDTKHTLFAPRVGVAYRATPSTVFHGGYGITYLPNDLAGLGGAGVMPFISPINQDFTTVSIASGATPLQTILGCIAGNLSLSSAGCAPLGLTQVGLAPPPGRSLGQAFMKQYASTSKYLAQPISGAAPYSYRPTATGPVFSNQNKPYPWVQQWNIALSHEFKGDFMAEISYSGLHGSNMPGMGGSYPNPYSLDELGVNSSVLQQAYSSTLGGGIYAVGGSKAGQGLTASAPCANANGEVMSIGQCLRPNPNYSSVGDTNALLAHQNYSSVQVSAEKRFKSAGVIKANYSWGRNLDNADTQTGNIEKGGAVQGVTAVTVPQDYNNPQGEYGIISYNVSNRFVVSYLLNLPFGKGQKFGNNLGSFGDAMVSGWSLNGITIFQNGFPLWFITASQNELTGSFGGGGLRPNVVAGCNKKVSGGGQARVLAGAWFNTNCFVTPTSASDPAGQLTFGNEPRVDPDLNGDGVKNFDMSFQKSTPIFEKSSFVFRAEFFNVFNRVQFAEPFPKVGSVGQFGVPSYQVNSPRQIQLSARVTF